MKYLIIGGVAGGATVAARLRRNDEKAQIILFERGEYVSYANCGLPYYIGGTIKERNKLFVQTVKGFVSRFRIDIRTRQEVTRILPGTKQVEVKNLQSGEVYTESYDKLVLSPGAEPLRPRIDGIDSPKIFTLRNVPDTDAIKGFLQQMKPKKAVVVGGGFIGLEMAENLHEAGVQVTVIEMADQVMAPLDFSMAAMVHQHLTSKGVTLLLGDGVKNLRLWRINPWLFICQAENRTDRSGNPEHWCAPGKPTGPRSWFVFGRTGRNPGQCLSANIRSGYLCLRRCR